MVTPDISKKRIGNFADNNTPKYTGKEEMIFADFLSRYVDNTGFFVLLNEDNQPIGYIDMIDVDSVKKIMNDENERSKTLKHLRGENKLRFRNTFVDYNDSVISVLKKLNEIGQNYLPVIKEGNLIGRVSKKIIEEKIEELY